jgi:hypothetical protein
VLAFFSDLDLPFAVKQNPAEWRKTVDAVEKLKAAGIVATR